MQKLYYVLTGARKVRFNAKVLIHFMSIEEVPALNDHR